MGRGVGFMVRLARSNMQNPARRSLRFLLLAAGWFCVSASVVSAQEVEWRNDYRKARQEAAEKNRPLVLDVGTDQCYWCNHLDQRTFHYPAAIALLNARFIPLRVNA